MGGGTGTVTATGAATWPFGSATTGATGTGGFEGGTKEAIGGDWAGEVGIFVFEGRV